MAYLALFKVRNDVFKKRKTGPIDCFIVFFLLDLLSPLLNIVSKLVSHYFPHKQHVLTQTSFSLFVFIFLRMRVDFFFFPFSLRSSVLHMSVYAFSYSTAFVLANESMLGLPF